MDGRPLTLSAGKAHYAHRAKRTHAATQMKRVQRVNDSLAQSGGGRCAASTLRSPTQRFVRIGAIVRPHDLPNHKLEFGKSPLHPNGLRCVFRTHAATQMKRVQRGRSAASTFDSLAQVWGRAAPNGLPAENMARPMCLRKNVLYRAADSVTPYSVGIAIRQRTIPK